MSRANQHAVDQMRTTRLVLPLSTGGQKPAYGFDLRFAAPTPAFNPLDPNPEVTLQVTPARRPPRGRIRNRRQGGMRQGSESGAARTRTWNQRIMSPLL